jgi:fibronectin-binding autotransporter adhesin
MKYNSTLNIGLSTESHGRNGHATTRTPLKIWTGLVFLAGALFSVSLCPLRAQVVNDGATNTLSNVTNTIPGDVTMGTNGSFTLLVISDNVLLNSNDGTVGLGATAKTNEVQLVSPTARWLMGNQFFIGNSGSFNRLVVSNGATVQDWNGSLGWNDSASNNLAIVTGPGSLWNNANVVHIGFNGPGNQLIVSHGGVVQDSTATFGVTATSHSNSAVVSGFGSAWTNSANLLFNGGGGNQLVISNGGFVQNLGGSVGSSVSSSNNIVTVKGAGSIWNNTADLYVGPVGAGNRLFVSAGGLVRSMHGAVGANATASNNLAVISDAGSIWSNAGDLNLGAFSANNHLIVSNGAVVMNNKGAVGFTASQGYNTALVTGAGSRWTNQGALYVGETGISNRLVVSNGGVVQCSYAEIGRNISSSHNEAVITGSGSTWASTGIFFLGDDGNQNRLVISNGATLRNLSGYVAGYQSSSNIALVTGSGSLWTNTLDLNMGFSGPGNLLIVSDTARLASSNGVVGYDPGCNNNIVQITDPGSLWTNKYRLYVGRSGSLNQLIVTNGATLLNGDHSFLGYNANANSNLTVITGTGSTWRNDQDLYVGYNGSANQLAVNNGAVVFSRRGLIGENHASNNVVVVTGSGSVWSNTMDIVIGRFRSGNQLVINNGAMMDCGSAGLGVNQSCSNNTALISGPGSVWKLATALSIGSSIANRVTISNGAAIYCNEAYVGFSTAGNNNEMLITGPGSTLTNLTLYVGSGGSGNRLVLTNGGFVKSAEVILGGFSASPGNRLLVHNGTMIVTNASVAGILDVRGGTNVLNSGYVEVDRLVVTNSQGKFELNGGTFITRSIVNNNGRVFDVGSTNGFGPAVLNLAGNGAHFFADGLNVKSNGSLLGNGSLIGTLTVQPLGTLSPGGSSVGKFILNNTPSLAGVTVMDISKNGPAFSSDQVEVAASLTYGGSLVVTRLGSTALSSGDRFQLFSAISYSGSFSSLTLPPLNAGLIWTNKLAVDGSIEVVNRPLPHIASIMKSGASVVVVNGTNGPPNATYFVLASTNVALPLSNWSPILTNQFDGSGNFSFSNVINPALPQRYFMLQVP